MADEEKADNSTDDSKTDDASSSAEVKGSGKSGMLVVIIIGLLVMSVTPVISFIVVKKTLPPTVETVSPQDATEETAIDLESMTVNIYGTKGTRLLRIRPHLVFSEGRIEESLKKLDPVIVDKIITAASRMTLDELEGAKGQEALKKDIISEINSAIKGEMKGALIRVYFRDFLIQ